MKIKVQVLTFYPATDKTLVRSRIGFETEVDIPENGTHVYREDNRYNEVLNKILEVLSQSQEVTDASSPTPQD